MSEKIVPELVKYDDIRYSVQARKATHGFIPLHWHSYYEVELFVSGEVTQIANGKVYECVPGCVSVMKPTDFHSLIPKNESFGLKKFIFMSDKLSSRMLSLTSRLSCVMEVGGRFERISGVFDELIASCGDRSELGCELSENLAERIFIELAMCDSLVPASREFCGSEMVGRLSRVMSYISENFTEKLSLSDAAMVVNVSPDYLSRIFSKELGTTFSDYLKIKRLRYATSLLIGGDYSIEEIARSSGFSSLTFFNRAFNGWSGMSPLEYRRKWAVAITPSKKNVQATRKRV